MTWIPLIAGPCLVNLDYFVDRYPSTFVIIAVLRVPPGRSSNEVVFKRSIRRYTTQKEEFRGSVSVWWSSLLGRCWSGNNSITDTKVIKDIKTHLLIATMFGLISVNYIEEPREAPPDSDHWLWSLTGKYFCKLAIWMRFMDFIKNKLSTRSEWRSSRGSCSAYLSFLKNGACNGKRHLIWLVVTRN